jgi:hypothetical protein
MYLIYVDESGNTGPNLDDPQQPMHLLAGVFVPEDEWMGGYEDLRIIRCRAAEACRSKGVMLRELHAVDMYHGTRDFRSVPKEVREDLICDALRVLVTRRLSVVYACAVKPAIRSRWPQYDRDPGADLWRDLIQACSGHLTKIGLEARALLIADESHLKWFARHNIRDVEMKSWLPEPTAGARYPNLLDTVHFVASWESPYIQLADLVAYFAMRAWRAGGWKKLGADAHYDRFIAPCVKAVRVYPSGYARVPESNDG